MKEDKTRGSTEKGKKERKVTGTEDSVTKNLNKSTVFSYHGKCLIVRKKQNTKNVL